MNEFDAKALNWDNNPIHWDRSKAIAEEMRKVFPFRLGTKALEFGAGTGILSFMLKDYFDEITLMDSSPEMVRIINEKIEVAGVKNFKPLLFDLEHNEYTGNRFDLIFTQMVLHHVSDIELIIDRFFKMLSPGGNLAIADLYPEDGSFHGDGFKGHLGFDVEALAATIGESHFINISHRQCYVINREMPGQKDLQFPVFLLTANRI
jgi:ubiquinone/menaquinone biosynthesis C-methylase UbiE